MCGGRRQLHEELGVLARCRMIFPGSGGGVLMGGTGAANRSRARGIPVRPLGWAPRVARGSPPRTAGVDCLPSPARARARARRGVGRSSPGEERTELPDLPADAHPGAWFTGLNRCRGPLRPRGAAASESVRGRGGIVLFPPGGARARWTSAVGFLVRRRTREDRSQQRGGHGQQTHGTPGRQVPCGSRTRAKSATVGSEGPRRPRKRTRTESAVSPALRRRRTARVLLRLCEARGLTAEQAATEAKERSPERAWSETESPGSGCEGS
ncbi:hypothetical protein ABH917_003544 [Thermobifida halotolerans]